MAVSTYRDKRLKLSAVYRSTTVEQIIDEIGKVSNNAPILFAFDAPLGWPASLGDNLSTHSAGKYINEDANLLFRRETDRVVKQKINKLPLEVGANLIARTAHSALNLINQIEQRTNTPMSLAWNQNGLNEMSVIEVYPAATLKSHEINSTGYKKNNEHAKNRRREIINDLSDLIGINIDIDPMVDSDDALDAVICTIAGMDFLDNRCIKPSDQVLAEKEGWIWVKDLN